MEQGYEITLTHIRRAVLEQADINSLYIPLRGKHTTNLEEEPFDLAEKIGSFFVFNDTSNYDPKVMLLMGDTGSGKSMFSQQLHQQLWRDYKSGDSIPLWIPLSELQNPFEGAVEEVLKKYGCSESQIAEIKTTEKFIFVVDGYDELHQFQNCYVTNKWYQWNAKILMTCRSQALYYQKDPDKYFMPFNGEKRLPILLRKLYVAAFSKEQISAYVKKYQLLNAENRISEEDFAKVPGLAELINTPFLLHLAVEALPDILANQVNNEKMTQAKLYDVFMERWFTRQVEKLSAAGLLKNTEKNTKQQFWDYCKRLAQQMHEKEVGVIPYHVQKVGGRLFGKQEQASSWESFFNEDFEILRSACPLKRFGEHHYGFVHASMIEYFATRAMYENIQQNESEKAQAEMNDKEKEERLGQPASPREDNHCKSGIHYRIFSQERNAIQFLADRIEMSEAFKQKMLGILEASKQSQRFAVGAANAITALVRVGVRFNGANLSAIKISGADISGGYFDQADLSNSDLRQSLMRNVWLSGANLEGGYVEGINLGEYPGIKQDDAVECFDFREDLQRCVSGSGKNLILWDTATGERLNKLQGHSDEVSCVQFSPNGKWIVSGSGSDDNTIRIWEVATGAEIAVLPGHEKFVNSVAFSPNGENVVSIGGHDHTVRIRNVVKAEKTHNMIGHHDRVESVQFSPDGEWVVSGGDYTIRIWAVAGGGVIELTGEDDAYERVHSVQFSPDGRRLVSGCDDGTLQLWDVASQELIAELHGHDKYVTSVAFSPEGERVVSASADNTVRVWDTISQKALFVLRGHEDCVQNVQFSHDGKRVISGSEDKTLRIWDVVGEPFLARGRKQEGHTNGFQLSQDGGLIGLSIGPTVRIWEVLTGKERVVLHGHDRYMGRIQFSPDGKLIASGGSDRIIRLWNVESGQMVRELKGHKSMVLCFAFSPDGERVVSGGGESSSISDLSGDTSIRIWEVSSGKELMVLKGPDEIVMSVVFSHDGKRVFSGSLDDTLSVWELSSQSELGRWQCEDLGTYVSFSSNKDLAAYSARNYIRIVDMQNGKMISEIPVADNVDGIQFIWDSHYLIMANKNTIQICDIANKQRIIVWKFHDIVQKFSYHNNGTLMVGFNDHSIECWQKTGDKNDDHLELRWSTNIDSPGLFVEGLRASQVIGLSDQNRRLLEQRGAILAAPQSVNSILQSPAKSHQPPSSAELISKIAQRIGSPIHQRPDLSSPSVVKKEAIFANDDQVDEEGDQQEADPDFLVEQERDSKDVDEKEGCHCCVIA